MESASVDQTQDPRPDGPQRKPSTDGELARAHEQLKSAEEELARLDRLVSGLERGGLSPLIRQSPPIPQEGTGAARGDAAVDEAPKSEKPKPENQAHHPGLRRDRLMPRALVGLV